MTSFAWGAGIAAVVLACVRWLVRLQEWWHEHPAPVAVDKLGPDRHRLRIGFRVREHRSVQVDWVTVTLDYQDLSVTLNVPPSLAKQLPPGTTVYFALEET